MSDPNPSLTSHSPSLYHTNASFVFSPSSTSPILSLLSAQPGESIIDLGCGTGELTVQLKETVGDHGRVVGVDSNDVMLKSARSLAPSITFQLADIQDFDSFISSHPSLHASFDAVFSSATFHWCKRSPTGVVQLMEWLLKPGGRAVFEFGGFGNVCGIRGALHQVVRMRGADPLSLDPWYFPTPAQYESVLRTTSLIPLTTTLTPRPTPLPTSLLGWLRTFARGSFLSKFTDDDAEEVMREVQEMCRVDNYWSEEVNGQEGWEVMYVRLRGVAQKPM